MSIFQPLGLGLPSFIGVNSGEYDVVLNDQMQILETKLVNNSIIQTWSSNGEVQSQYQITLQGNQLTIQLQSNAVAPVNCVYSKIN